MSYKINWGISDGVFAVPDYVYNTILKNMSPASAKVLLCIFGDKDILKLSPKEIAELAGKGVTADDVEDALSDMGIVGLIYKDSNAPILIEAAVQDNSDKSNPIPSLSPEKSKERSVKMFTPSEISERINSNGELAFIFSTAETMLGRILNHTEHRTLLWLFDYYGFHADVLLMIIEYCKSIDKTNIGYIEKIAVSWHDNNITTHEMAENEIKRLQNYYSFEGKIKTRLGINRNLISKEKELINDWSSQNIDIELVFLAYEKTISSTGKLSLSYMSKIISDWNQNGIKTVDEALNNDLEFRKNKKSNIKNASPDVHTNNNNDRSYDLDKILEYSKNNLSKFKEKL